MSADPKVFHKEDMDFYLKELGKELKKEYGKHSTFELILVGGGAVALQYEFRDSTTDLDALLSSSISSAINKITDTYNLPNGWLNTDFTQTTSYSTKIREHSRHYRTFGGVLEVRTISDEYLIAMKVRAFRQYRHDISDIIGIIDEMKKAGRNTSVRQIERAFRELYGGNEEIPHTVKKFLSDIINSEDLSMAYQMCAKRENEAYRKVYEARDEVTPLVLEKYLDDILNAKMQEDMDQFLSRVSLTNHEPDQNIATTLWRVIENTGYFCSCQIWNANELRLDLKNHSDTYIAVNLETLEISVFKNDQYLEVFTMIVDYPDISAAYTAVSEKIAKIENQDISNEIEEECER